MRTLPLYHRGVRMNSKQGGQRLKALRLEARLTQDQLAQKAGVSQLIITRIETGKVASPSLEAAILIGRALGLGPGEVAQLFEV